jgi:hypothetical protein
MLRVYADRNGCIEAVRVRTVIERSGQWFIPTLDMDNRILKAPNEYLGGLQALEVAPPLTVVITIDGVYGAHLGVDDRQRSLGHLDPINQETLELPAILIDDHGDCVSYERAVRPAFDALWNAGGYAASANFDKNGRWTGPR